MKSEKHKVRFEVAIGAILLAFAFFVIIVLYSYVLVKVSRMQATSYLERDFRQLSLDLIRSSALIGVLVVALSAIAGYIIGKYRTQE